MEKAGKSKREKRQKNLGSDSRAIDKFAFQFALLGLGCFPVFWDAKRKTKRPKIKDWLASPVNLLLGYKELGDMYGITLSDEQFVLDYDARRDPERKRNGSQLLQLWKELELEETNTFIVRTGNGVHIYFSCLPGSRYSATVPGFPAIEVKSARRFVVGPGSYHPASKTAYTRERGSLLALEQVPESLREKCIANASNEGEHRVFTADDSELNRRRYIKYLTEPGSGDRGSFITACRGWDINLSEEAIVELMLEHYNDHRNGEAKTVEEIRYKVKNARDHRQNQVASNHAWSDYGEPDDSTVELFTPEWDKALNGRYQGTMNNLLNCWRVEEWPEKSATRNHFANPIKDMLLYNLYSREMEFTRPAPWHNPKEPAARQWADSDALHLKDYIARAWYIDGSIGIQHEAAEIAARENQIHPLRDWLNNLEWDRKPRLDKTLVNYVGCADSPYTREVTKNTFIGACKRIMEPGCKHDYMLILEGPQGIGKTEFVRAIGGDYYKDVAIDPKDKDSVLAMRTGWILEASEMEFLRKSDIASLKRFLTLRSDILRKPYGRLTEELQRQSIFIGTVNPSPEGYFRDATGNRRFWPVYCGRIDIPGFLAVRDQIFAESMHRYRNGEDTYILDKEIEAIAAQEQWKRMETDSWEETVAGWLSSSACSDPITNDSLAYEALNLSPSRFGQKEKERLGAIMRGLGYEKKSQWNSERKQTINIWIKPESQGWI